jgi:predicted small metal-binding protein
VIKLSCRDYGFECDFVAEGASEEVITKFGEHSREEHGIDYSKEALMQFIMRKR